MSNQDQYNKMVIQNTIEINPDFWKCQNCEHFASFHENVFGRCNFVVAMNNYVYSAEDVAKYVNNVKAIEERIVSPDNETWVGVNFGCIHFKQKQL